MCPLITMSESHKPYRGLVHDHNPFPMYYLKIRITLEIPSYEVPFNERSLIRARYHSLQRAADQPLFPHYSGIKRARI